MKLKNKLIRNFNDLPMQYLSDETLLSLEVEKQKILSMCYDGDIGLFIERSYGTVKKKEIHKKLGELGFESSLSIFRDYKKNHGPLQKTEISDLVINDLYSYMEISALARNFNHQKGMYYIEEHNSRYAIVKATFSSDSNMYNDGWIDEEGALIRYYLQNESSESKLNRDFSHKPNRKIYEALDNCILLPIYIFIRYTKGSNYIFKGAFEVESISEESDYFVFKKY